MADDALQPDTPSPSTTQGRSCKLFLGGLSWETTEEKLRSHFAVYGEIAEVVVMRDRNTNKPRGFGFITFKQHEVAELVCTQEHAIDGRTIDAKPSVPHGEGQKPRSKKIFVGGLAPDTSDEQFKEYFEQFGKILEAQIMQDHTSGRSRGFGFITFEEEGAVDKVFTAGSMHELNGKQVEVKNATPKGSGPQGVGRGRVGLGAGGRGAMMAGRGYEFGQLQTSYGMAPYNMNPAAGFGMMGGYGGYGMAPYGAYGNMMMGGYPGSYGFGGYNNYPGQSSNLQQFSPPHDPSTRFHPYASSGRTRPPSQQR